MSDATALRLVDAPSEMNVHTLMDKVEAMILGLQGHNVQERAAVLCEDVVSLIRQDQDGAILPCIALRITDKRLQSAFLEAIGNRLL